MEIRPAQVDELDPLMEITQRCIEKLDEKGINQWNEIYPSRTDYQEDINKQSLYAITILPEGGISGCIWINELEYPGYENADWEGSGFFYHT